MSSNLNMRSPEQIAKEKDESDVLKDFRNEFIFPMPPKGKETFYFAGNSLGLQPKRVKEYVVQEIDEWARLAVDGHTHAKNPWVAYHEYLNASTARLVGAKPHEVVVMNSLTVNLHLMMVSFFRPSGRRNRILIEGGAFPSDQYAVKSQLLFHGLPETCLVELKPREGEDLLRPDDILAAIAREGEDLALVLLGNVNYLTGQHFSIPNITQAAHKVGAKIGFDLAHGAGNLLLNLNQDGPDFAVWCSYKYLNAGPGAIAGCFIHERHAQNFTLPRFAGWWGHNKASRFKMGPLFDAIQGADGWQLSNPPIFQLAALRASMEIFDRAQMRRIKVKADDMTTYLEFMLRRFPEIEVISPRDLKQRGTQLSLRIKGRSKELLSDLAKEGVVCDFREPNIIRVAPVALYTRYHDLNKFVEILTTCLKKP